MRISDWSSDVCSSDLIECILDLRQTQAIKRDRIAAAVFSRIAQTAFDLAARDRAAGRLPPLAFEHAEFFRPLDADLEVAVIDGAQLPAQAHPGERSLTPGLARTAADPLALLTRK